MEEIAPRNRVDHASRPTPGRCAAYSSRIGLVLVVLDPGIGVAIYAGAFIILAPMMQ